jgi:UDP-N-acetyl-D-mannosaminuronate dehydrogenase
MPKQPAQDRIAVLGLGYVGLPLTLALARAGFEVVGLDTDAETVTALLDGRDPNGEVAEASVANSDAVFTHNAADLAGCTAFIIAVRFLGPVRPSRPTSHPALWSFWKARFTPASPKRSAALRWLRAAG